jgi:hypothetical protein
MSFIIIICALKDGFLLDRRQLIPTGRETWEGVKVVIDAVLRRAREQPQSRRSEYSNNFTKRLSQFE